MILEKTPKSLRGELTRWLLEIDTGVFVGEASAVVRELLWEKCCLRASGGRCCQIWRMNNEQGFMVRMQGHHDREMIDFEGLSLVSVKNAEWAKQQQKFRIDIVSDE